MGCSRTGHVALAVPAAPTEGRQGGLATFERLFLRSFAHRCLRAVKDVVCQDVPATGARAASSSLPTLLGQRHYPCKGVKDGVSGDFPSELVCDGVGGLSCSADLPYSCSCRACPVPHGNPHGFCDRHRFWHRFSWRATSWLQLAP